MINAEHFNYLVKTYEEFTSAITKTKQRLLSLPGDNGDAEIDTLLKGQKAIDGKGKEDGLESFKQRATRELKERLVEFHIWDEWMKNIPGIGPFLAAKLIILYYYRFKPVCKECGGDFEKEDHKLVCVDCGKVAKDGLLKHKTEIKDFPTISKWWAYMGRHTVDGVMPKRKKGEMANWSTPGRTLGFHIGDQFNRQSEGHPYKDFFLERKKKHARNHPDWTKGHIHNAAKNETVKLFLAHFWTVARTLDGKPVSAPYAGAIMGHTNIIKPFYFDETYFAEN